MKLLFLGNYYGKYSFIVILKNPYLFTKKIENFDCKLNFSKCVKKVAEKLSKKRHSKLSLARMVVSNSLTR